ncbi:uncharacterized protein LOC116197156 isoform X2 [Punica granatum]|uniref:Uncharacterized protein LOC116197156 isoform X2 n=1 Tax=Punica granatum TaxID=22663 RepID=A0A6P8CIQ9_PUNGR|nr:uncharacterized protein LOC116197156 isoform X2 [Punica granatum]
MGDYLADEDDASDIAATVGDAINYAYFADGYGDRMIQMAPCYALALRDTNLLLDQLGFFSSINDIVYHILAISSHLTQQLCVFIENLVLSDVERYSEGSVVRSPQQPRSSTHSIHKSVSEDGSSSDPGILERRGSCPKEELVVNTRSEIDDMIFKFQGAPLIFQGLMLPLLSLRLACRFIMASWQLTISCLQYTQVRLCSIISRVQKTLRGSADDIGWLQWTPGMAPVVDGTSRFLELLDAIRNGEHALPDTFVYLLIPGLFSNHGPLYFVSTKRFFSKMGLACHIAKIHSEASVEHNAWELKQYIEELYWGSGKRVMLLGHSKGGVDAAAALTMFWPDLKDKVVGLALVQSPYGGTPIASDILREGQVADKETRRIMELVICKIIKGDIRALEDLTYEKRREFILKHKLPELPLISFHSEASIAPGVIATMTHIAHAELPWLPILNFRPEDLDNNLVLSGGQVPVVMPLSAAMAVCALHLKLRYGEKSDGLVTCRDAEVPGSVVIRPDRKLDHAWMVYSSRRRNPADPDSRMMCEAILTLLVELGRSKTTTASNKRK